MTLMLSDDDDDDDGLLSLPKKGMLNPVARSGGMAMHKRTRLQ